MERYRVAVVGSGFAGSILARILERGGLEVALFERGRHPRFAIGESSTPLAALALERLSRRYELPDLAWLAAYGRWSEHLPELRRGLKRGFTFYRHRPGLELAPTAGNRDRLLVAASPDDVVADSHWLRADVDAYLVERARVAGVMFRDSIEMRAARDGDRWLLAGDGAEGSVEVEADVVIDASGAGRFLQPVVPIASRVGALDLDTALVFGHVADLGPMPDFGDAPYPEQRAAVHHLIAEGWVYVLPFDDGVASAGILLRREALADLERQGIGTPEAIWQTILGRYPTLAAHLGEAARRRPLELLPRVQRLLARSAGRNWALLPHTFAFMDPMFSMGIAWSLLAVERLSSVLLGAERGGRFDREALAGGLERYDRLLSLEVEQMAALLEGAYLAMRDFELFTAQSFLYFAFVSFEEVVQRLFPEGTEGTPPAWRGLLAADDPTSRQLFAEAKARLESLAQEPPTESSGERFVAWIRDRIAERNIAGLADPRRRNLYPVDLDLLLERAELVGLTRDQMEAHLPLLRGSLASL